MSKQTTEQPTGFFPRHAKFLTHTSKKPYCIIEHADGTQWLVGMVLDNGRFMQLFQPHTDGKVTRTITNRDYHYYTIILGPFDKDSNETPIDTRYSDV